MRHALLALALALALVTATAHADTAPGWNDVPALVAFATQSVDKDLRACSKKMPLTIAMIASRDAKTGSTHVAMPDPGVGGRGFTPEENCLMAAIARISLPDLPASIDRIVLAHTVFADGVKPPPPENAFDDWRDPSTTLAKAIDPERLATCSAKPRTVRLVLDLRSGKTRVWLPAWQFHSPNGDGSTPPAEQKVKTCLEKVIASFKPPVLPKAMGELEVTLAP
jgi:hypothetical protein